MSLRFFELLTSIFKLKKEIDKSEIEKNSYKKFFT